MRQKSLCADDLAVIEKYSDMVYRMAYSMVKNPQDAEGNERHCDYSVDWHEELAGERVAFNEQWFVVSEKELEKLQVAAYRYVTDGCVKGDWEVVFAVGE